MKKTLGGNRLGNGKKIKVDLHGYGRSSFDISRAWRSTMTHGALTPCLCDLGLNGTTYEMDIKALAKTIPVVSPVFGSSKLQIDIFACPIRLYQGLLHNNATNIGLDMDKVLYPNITLGGRNNPKNKTNPSSLLNYFGIKGFTPEKKTFNAIPILAYYDIFKNYYSNKQEENAKAISWEYEDNADLEVTEIINHLMLEDGQILEYNAATQWQMPTTNIIKFEQIDGGYPTGQIIIKANNIKTIEDVNILSMTLQGGIEEIIKIENNTPIENNKLLTLIGIDSGALRGTIQFKEDEIIITPRSESGYNIIYGEINFLNRSYKQKIIDFPLSNIDKARREILKYSDIEDRVTINDQLNFEPYNLNLEEENINRNYKNLNGLCLKTYQNDIFNCWLKNEYVQRINEISSITPDNNGKITMDSLILAKKVYNVLNRIAVSGGTYEDWQESVYGEKAIRRAESPIYLGGLSATISFEEVVSTSASEIDGLKQPLATLGGKGTMVNNKGGKIVYKCEEPCFIIGICSITPYVDYTQGNKWYMTDLDNMDNLHKPEYDGIGFQNLIANNVVWSDSPNKALAKQTAWLNYQTAYNEDFGQFALDADEPNSLHHMVFRRNFETDEHGEITDFTSYIDPAKYNYAFADNSLEAQNFWIQIVFDITARRKMAATEIPNL